LFGQSVSHGAFELEGHFGAWNIPTWAILDTVEAYQIGDEQDRSAKPSSPHKYILRAYRMYAHFPVHQLRDIDIYGNARERIRVVATEMFL
jgi:hypothetical protein